MTNNPNDKLVPKATAIPSGLIPAVKKYKAVDDRLAEEMHALMVESNEAKAEVTRKLIDGGVLPPDTQYTLDVRYLDEHGIAFMWTAQPEETRTLH